MESESFVAALALALLAAFALRTVVILCTWFARQPFAGEQRKWVKEQLHKMYHLMFSGKLGTGREFQEMEHQRCRIFLRWCECLQLFVVVRLYQFSFFNLSDEDLTTSTGQAGALLSGGILLFLLLLFPKLVTPDTIDIMSTLGLLVPFWPLLTGPRDFAEIVFISSASFVGRFFLALFMKRLWIAVVLNVIYGALCVWQSLNDPTSDDLGVKAVLAAQTLALVFGACMNKWFMYEYVCLSQKFHVRTVEHGAVSSLLMACSDAVVEVDGDMKMLMDSPQLAGMLLRGTPSVVQGSNFAELFCPADKPRVEDYFSCRSKPHAVAMNARMLDGDSNEVKVELLQAQFHNTSGERCFLVGVREFQDTDTISAMYHPPRIAESAADSAPVFHMPEAVVFDACSFKILFASAAFQSLSALLGRGETPCYLQELSQEQGGCSLIGQAQHAVNSENQDGQRLSGPLLLYDRLHVTASIHFEHDGELDASVGVMSLELAGEGRGQSQPRIGKRRSLRSFTGHTLAAAVASGDSAGISTTSSTPACPKTGMQL